MSYSENHIILGIDPGKTGGYCFIDHFGSVLDYGRINTHDPAKLEALRIWDAGYPHNLIVYTEDVYAHRTKWNAGTALAHAKNIGFIQGYFGAFGVYVSIVPAKTWQSNILRINGIPAKDTKAASIEVARLNGIYTKNHNIADAVCIALYGQAYQRVIGKG